MGTFFFSILVGASIASFGGAFLELLSAWRERSIARQRAMSDRDVSLYSPGLLDSLLHRDEYLVLADFDSFVACQDRAAEAYLDREEWTRKSILNVARCGFFSSDRTMRQYAEEIWGVRPVEVKPG